MAQPRSINGLAPAWQTSTLGVINSIQLVFISTFEEVHGAAGIAGPVVAVTAIRRGKPTAGATASPPDSIIQINQSSIRIGSHGTAPTPRTPAGGVLIAGDHGAIEEAFPVAGTQRSVSCTNWGVGGEACGGHIGVRPTLIRDDLPLIFVVRRTEIIREMEQVL